MIFFVSGMGRQTRFSTVLLQSCGVSVNALHAAAVVVVVGCTPPIIDKTIGGPSRPVGVKLMLGSRMAPAASRATGSDGGD